MGAGAKYLNLVHVKFWQLGRCGPSTNGNKAYLTTMLLVSVVRENVSQHMEKSRPIEDPDMR